MQFTRRPEDKVSADKNKFSQSRLFTDENILQLTLNANFREVQKDRDDEPVIIRAS
jgi:hypothetical protein